MGMEFTIVMGSTRGKVSTTGMGFMLGVCVKHD